MFARQEKVIDAIFHETLAMGSLFSTQRLFHLVILLVPSGTVVVRCGGGGWGGEEVMNE